MFIFKSAEVIGQDLQKNSTANDYLLVWGNVPSINIYAHRKPWQHSRLFFYAKGQFNSQIELDLLHQQIKYFPPKLFLFFQLTQKERFNIESICENTKLPYTYKKTYTIRELNSVFNEPLYELDKTKFSEMLFDRFMNNYYSKEKTVNYHFIDKFYPAGDDDYPTMLKSRLASYLDNDDISLLMNFASTEAKSEIALYINIFNFIKAQQLEIAEELLRQITDTAYYGLYYLAAGEIAFLRQDLETAKTSFRKSLQANHYLATTWNDSGVVAYQLKDFTEAKKCFKLALELLPDYAEAKENLDLLS
jgi:tetratricopeptide (TPR) repeat protein